MRSRLLAPLLLAAALACSSDDEDPALAPLTGAAAVAAMQQAGAALAARPEVEAQEIEVQHLLVSFQGAGTSAVRTQAAAETLAAELLARVGAGEDFAKLVQTYTDDQYPGIYGLTSGPDDPGRNMTHRAGLVAAMGDTGWRLQVGELGVALYDPVKSPFGWHLIKRTR